MVLVTQKWLLRDWDRAERNNPRSWRNSGQGHSPSTLTMIWSHGLVPKQGQIPIWAITEDLSMLSASSQDIVPWDATPSQVPRKWVPGQEVERGVSQYISSSPEFPIFPPRVHAKHMHAMNTHQISTPWRWPGAFPYMFESSTCQVDPEGLTCWLGSWELMLYSPGQVTAGLQGQRNTQCPRELPLGALLAPMA